MHHPQEIEGDSYREAKLKHYVNTNFVQALLYVEEARRCKPTWTVEDLPRTSYTAQDRPETDRIRFHLYCIAKSKYEAIEQVMEQAAGNGKPLSPVFLDELRSKVIHLLPLPFEAFLSSVCECPPEDTSLNDIGVGDTIDKAAELNAPAKTFAQLADVILSSAQVRVGDQENPVPPLPLSAAIDLLCQVINAIQSQPDYDVVKAARWIRCVVQMVLDFPAHPETTESGAVDEREYNLQVVESIVDEALLLTRDSSNKGKQECYPSDELQWLSSTLFNLAVDYHVAGKGMEAKKWAGKAVEVADALGRNLKGGGGDDGSLARMLRERCRKVGWM